MLDNRILSSEGVRHPQVNTNNDTRVKIHSHRVFSLKQILKYHNNASTMFLPYLSGAELRKLCGNNLPTIKAVVTIRVEKIVKTLGHDVAGKDLLLRLERGITELGLRFEMTHREFKKVIKSYEGCDLS